MGRPTTQRSRGAGPQVALLRLRPPPWRSFASLPPLRYGSAGREPAAHSVPSRRGIMNKAGQGSIACRFWKAFFTSGDLKRSAVTSESSSASLYSNSFCAASKLTAFCEKRFSTRA